MEVVDRGTIKLSVAQRCDATKKVLEKLDSPPDMGAIEGKLSRKEIYG
jgi:hypothetical protein